MKIGLCDIPSESGLSVPYLWCLLKTYYEQNGVNATEWEWSDPWQFRDGRSDDEIISHYKENPVDVFGFSVYVWNEVRINTIAEQIKQNNPSCLIVYGGPQNNIKYNQDFFKEHPWVDIVVPGDAYGELIITAILDNFSSYNTYDYTVLPYVYYTNSNKDVIWSTKPIDKRHFNWASNVFQAQEKFLLPVLGGKSYFSLTETSRGCPYRCSYCDWGGGTYTKTVRKPFSTILSEFDWLAKNHCSYVGVTDANFGIFDIDVTVAEHIKSLKEQHGYPLVIHTESAKNHPERVAKITKLFAEAGLLESYRISVQSINDEIKQNIDRIDIPFNKQLRIFKDLQASIQNLPIKIETIMGLPGASIQSQLDELDIIIEAGLPIPRPSTWMLLPESPAFAPAYRSQYQLKTVYKFNMSQPWAQKKDFDSDKGVHSMLEWYNPNVESVVGSYSYSQDDWIYMQLLYTIAKPLTTSGGHRLLAYMKKKHKMKPSVLIKMLADLIYSTYDDKSILELTHFYKVLEYYRNWMHSDSINFGIDHNQAFPLVFSPMYYTTWRILMRPYEFYSIIEKLLLSKYNDVKLNDLCQFITNSVIDLAYDPAVGKSFTSEYNWLEYFTQNKRLIKKKTTFKISDTIVELSTNRTHAIDWQTYADNLINYEKQYFYLMCTNIDMERTSLTIEAI